MDFKEINLFVSDISDCSEIIPWLVAIVFARKKPLFNILKWFFLVSSIVKITTLFLAKDKINNMPLFHWLAIWEVGCLYIFYNKFLFDKTYWWGLFVIVAFNISNTIFNEGLFEFNSFGWAVNTFISLCFGLATFYKLYNSSSPIAPERSPVFIVNSGFMIYFSGALFTYILGTEILSADAKDFFHNSWIIQSISNIMKNVIVAIGVWLSGKDE